MTGEAALSDLEVFRQLLVVMPLHAEEGLAREDIDELELVSQIQASVECAHAAGPVVSTIRRLFDSLALLDPSLLTAGRWAFISFPASLVARSILETMATPGNTFFVPDYWTQGTHRPPEIVEEQRELLRRMENQRTSNAAILPHPIRTVHVTWGLLRLGNRFLLHRREDKTRPDVGAYVFPGGRLDLTDLAVEDRSAMALRELFNVDSTTAIQSQRRTLERELREELDLFPSEYVATHRRQLEPFHKVEGTRNNHAYTAYNIAIYSVKLTQTGELKVLDRVTHAPAEWAWFSTQELVAGKRPDGKRAFVDALLTLPSAELNDFLSSGIPDSSDNPPVYRKKGDAIELPSSVGEPILIGDAGRQKPVRLSLSQQAWELLMLLAWHARGLEMSISGGLFVFLGGGWIKLRNEELLETAQELVEQFQNADLRLVECDAFGHCRLSISAEHLYFEPKCFEYFWDVESEEKPIVLTLKKIDTKWGPLKERQISIRLSPLMIKAMPALEAGKEHGADPDTIRREFKRLLAPTEAMGLHQFIAKRYDTHEILVPNARVC